MGSVYYALTDEKSQEFMLQLKFKTQVTASSLGNIQLERSLPAGASAFFVLTLEINMNTTIQVITMLLLSVHEATARPRRR